MTRANHNAVCLKDIYFPKFFKYRERGRESRHCDAKSSFKEGGEKKAIEGELWETVNCTPSPLKPRCQKGGAYISR